MKSELYNNEQVLKTTTITKKSTLITDISPSEPYNYTKEKETTTNRYIISSPKPLVVILLYRTLRYCKFFFSPCHEDILSTKDLKQKKRKQLFFFLSLSFHGNNNEVLITHYRYNVMLDLIWEKLLSNVK